MGVVLDMEITPELKEQGEVREVVSKVQKLRKEAGLVLTDRVGLYYDAADDAELAALLEKHAEHVGKSTGTVVQPVSKLSDKSQAMYEADLPGMCHVWVVKK